MASRKPRDHNVVRRAFDELRFGASRTLNLRAMQPTALQARTLAEQWLRRLQVEGAKEALVITGRGNRSVDGYSPVREAVLALLPSLRRRNVITHVEEHTPGSFIVTFARVGALLEAPKRRRERSPPSKPSAPETLGALDGETRSLLHDLATISLAQLGIFSPTTEMVEGEMRRQFGRLAAAVPPTPDREALLQQAVLRAIEEIDT